MKNYYLFILMFCTFHTVKSQSFLPLTLTPTPTSSIKSRFFPGPALAAGATAAPTVSFYGSASANSSDELIENITSSQKLSAVIRLRENGFSNINVGFNNRGIRPSAIPKDSLDLVSLMFPETGNTGLMLGFQQFIYSHSPSTLRNHSVYVHAEGSIRQNKITIANDSTTENIQFTVLNANAGLYYRFSNNSNTNPFAFTFGLYYNNFNIPNEDAKAFSNVFTPGFIESNKNSFINSFGSKCTVTYNNYTLFADMRFNRKTGFLLDDNPLKGTVFNIGTIVSTEIFKIP